MCVRAYVCTYVRVCVWLCVCACVHVCACVRPCAFAVVYVCAFVCAKHIAPKRIRCVQSCMCVYDMDTDVH